MRNGEHSYKQHAGIESKQAPWQVHYVFCLLATGSYGDFLSPSEGGVWMRYILEIVTNTTRHKPAAKFISTDERAKISFAEGILTMVSTLHSIIPDKDKEDGLPASSVYL